MERTTHAPIAPLTTLRVGGPAAELVCTDSTRELADAVREAYAAGTAVFVLGGGSNVLVADAGFDGIVVHPRQQGMELLAEEGPDAERAVLVRCEAGVVWDDLAAFACERGLAGTEALSGIPGCIGSAVMQNIGAYGQEMGTSLVRCTLYDRATGSVRSWQADELRLGYRTSVLRASMEGPDADGRVWGPSPRWVVLDATFDLARRASSRVEHAQLARALSVEIGSEMPVEEIREAVLGVRGVKAMLADDPAAPAPDHDRWSTGSFFTNPVLSEAQASALPADAPRYPAAGGVKTSAAWLIEHAGFPKGFGVHGEDSRAALSHRHTLALTNRGDATAADVLELARTVRTGVFDAFGILLAPETVLVGETL